MRRLLEGTEEPPKNAAVIAHNSKAQKGKEKGKGKKGKGPESQEEAKTLEQIMVDAEERGLMHQHIIFGLSCPIHNRTCGFCSLSVPND